VVRFNTVRSTSSGWAPRISLADESSSLDSLRFPYLCSPGRAAVERSRAPLASMFLTAPGAQGGLFLNGDRLGCWGDTSSGAEPSDGSAGRHRPACGGGEREGVDRCAVQLRWGEELVEGGEVGGRVINSCRQKKAVSSRLCQSDFKCSPRLSLSQK